MKMSKILALSLALVMMLACFTSCKPQGGNDHTGDNTGKTETIKIWVSDIQGVTDLTLSQIEKFIAANPEYQNKYTFEVSPVAEGDASSAVLADVAQAPDIFCFAQDQLARLVQASALAAPGVKAAESLREANDKGSIAAASVGGTIYAYPLTSDNGYYMYYDKSVITNPDDLATIVADCEAANKNVCFELENAWYTASFFFATGCHSNWTMSPEGKFTSVDDTFNSEAGLVAMKGMQIVTKSPKFINSASNFEGAGIVVSGIWMANTAEEVLGENFAVTDLPSFTVDGETYHLGSYSGNKLMGVKPQADAAKAAFLSKLAQYLTGAECQLERYKEFQWGPSNVVAQDNEAVKANPSLGALVLQNEFAQPQGNIEGSWWDIAKLLGTESRMAGLDEAGNYDADRNLADLQAALDSYSESINKIFQKTDEELKAWSVIGNICGSSWDTDFPMTEVSAGVFESAVLELHQGEEYKCRQGGSWTNNFGANGEFNAANNCVVEADGKYIVRLTVTSERTATLELIPQ